MTISQALRHASKLKGQLAALQARATSSIYFATESPPAYKFSECIEKHAEVERELVALETKMAVTNASTLVAFEGQELTLAFAVKSLQALRSRIAMLKGLTVQPQESMTVSNTEYGEDGKFITKKTAYTCAFPEAKRDAEVERLQERFDRLNDVVEKINGSTPLISRVVSRA
jgi:hypothetical protein